MAMGKPQEGDIPLQQEETLPLKRESIKTVEILEHEKSRLKATRSAVCGKVTGKSNQIKVLLNNANNAKEVKVKLREMEHHFKELNDVDTKYGRLLTEEERAYDYANWVQPREEEHSRFRQHVEGWLLNIPKESAINTEEDIKPSDSVSQVGRSHRKRSKSRIGTTYSHCSATSRASNASKISAMAKTAEVLAQMASLEEQQLLQDQAARIRRRQEEEIRELEDIQKKMKVLKLKTVLAAQEAKIKVYEEHEYDGSYCSLPNVTSMDNKGNQDVRPSSTDMTGMSRQAAPTSDVNNTAENQDRGSDTISDSSSGRSYDMGLSAVMQQQNQVTQLLIDHNKRAALPPQTIPTFRGDPLKYKAFIRAFRHGIEKKTEDHEDRLYFLEQYTEDEPKEIVSSCIHMDPNVGYKTARKLLEEKYGSPHVTARAYTKQAEGWPDIKAEDKTALNSFALFLTKCDNAMKGDVHLRELDHHSNLKLLVDKLPYKMRESWRRKTHGILQDRPVRFTDLVEYVNKESLVMSNVLFGDLNSTPAKERNAKYNKKAAPKAKHTAFAVSTDAKATNNPCTYCEETNHDITGCKSLAGKTYKEKTQFIRSKGMCYGCLKKTNHLVKDCTNKLTCDTCKLPHPTVLHREKRTSMPESQPVTTSVGRVNVKSTKTKELTGIPVIMPVVLRCKSTGVSLQTYAFIDTGSDAVFCTEKIRQQLNVGGRKTKLNLHTITGSKLADSYMIKGLEVTDLDGNNAIPLPVTYTQNEIPVSKNDIITQQDIAGWSHLRGVQLVNIDADIGLLIGNNVHQAFEPWEVINSQDNGPYAIRTVLGWAVNGPLKGAGAADQDNSTQVSVSRIQVGPQVDKQLAEYFNREFSERTIDDKPERSIEDKRFMDIMAAKTEYVDNHYQVPLPFRQDDIEMPDNKSVIEQRMRQLKKRFVKDPSYHEDYKMFMEAVIAKGYAEMVPDEELVGEIGKRWYLPHHGVYHPQKKKIRVVFDCGAEYRGTSLNKELMQGPDLTNSLVGVLTRFRQEPVALMADIEAMFSQVRVPKENCDFQRFLWWPNGDIDKPIMEHRMKVHIFGATSSPSCANYALKKTANDNKGKCKKAVVNTIKNNFYVDDMLKSVSTEEEGKLLAKDLIGTCKQGGFRLTKWISNHRGVLDSIPEEERAKQVKNLDMEQDSLPTERALGMQWDIEKDVFGFQNKIKDKSATRRGILGIVSSVFDPLGLVAPAILPPKIILQDLCKLKLDWDEEIPPKHRKRWNKWLSELPKLGENFSVNRCMKPDGFGNLVSTQLHHFSDASESGYGAVTYLRMVNEYSKVHCTFLMGKSRVAPLKQITIPRMELTAATVAVRMDKMIQRELDIPIDETFFWTDSMTVLRYINNETSRFHTFVANRVNVIREGSEPTQWGYVNTNHNPADDCSRGQSIDTFLKNERWLNGPGFLWETADKWPDQQNSMKITIDDPEVKRKVTVNIVAADESKESLNKLISHYSKWYDLKKAVAWILKVKHMLLKRCKDKQKEDQEKAPDESRTLTVQDLQHAEDVIIGLVQQDVFAEDINNMKKKTGGVKRGSRIYKLDPFLGDDGLLHVGGRLSQSTLTEEAKHPLILPKDNHVSELILREIHESSGHFGRSYILSKLRERYWILNANSAARRMINTCVICRRQRAKVGEQKMADLPADRITPDEPPFTRVGVDYFGPIEIKQRRSTVKRYGVIFTCLAIRAVHIEKADSLSTDSYINALRRFISRRGLVKEIRSDNGTNFVGANRELKEEIDKWNQARIKGFLLRKGIEWIFNPPSGSHFGGVWERQIRTIRQLLRAITKQQQLDDEGLQTFFCEVEYIINSRPITKPSDDARDMEALTPNMLLTMKGATLPPSLTEKSDLYARRRWRQVQYMADLFWKRWTREYLPLLQERQKWSKTKPNLKIGDIVLIKDDNMHRCVWPMGRVVEVMPDSKGVVRRVMVKTRTNVLERPYDKLCTLLEAEC